MTRRTPLAPLALLAALAALPAPTAAQAPAPTAQGASAAVFPPGSAVGVVPAPGMRPETRFSGFSNPDTGSAVVVQALQGANFAQAIAAATPEALAARGLRNARVEDVTVDGRPARLATGEQAGSALFLLFAQGPGDSAAIVTGRAGVGPGEAERVRAAVLSATFRAAPGMGEQLAALPFRLGDTGPFRPRLVVAGNGLLLLPEGAALPGPTNPAPVQLIVAASTGRAPATAAEREAFARRALGTVPGLSDLRETSVETPARGGGGAEWLEITGTARQDGRDVLVHQALRTTADPAEGYVRAILIAPAGAEGERWLAAARPVIASVAPARR